jgi:hypothetical protein
VEVTEASIATTTVTPTEEISATLPSMGGSDTDAPSTDSTESPTAESGKETSATPAALPITGVDNVNHGLAIALTVIAVLALVMGLAMWEKRGNAS